MRSTKPERPEDDGEGRRGVAQPGYHRDPHQRVQRRRAEHAPTRAAALSFLEYLASDEGQRHFADSSNEWPAVDR